MKKGILVVSFGTSHLDTMEKCITAVEHKIQEACPQVECYRAFTSEIIMGILKERNQIKISNVEEALVKMHQDGITHVYIQPTHIIDGIENNKVKKIKENFKNKFEEIVIGEPLLSAQEDYEQVVKVIWGELSKEVEDDLLIFMGHGSEHESNYAYEKLEQEFHRQGHNNVFVATVEAKPDINMVIERIKKLKRKRVIVTPFMLVAGEHAKNDMAGKKDSYYSRLSAEGYDVTCIMKGLGEYEVIRTIFLKHLVTVLS